MNPIFCPDSVPAFLHFFDLSIAPHLLFYTYGPTIILSLFLGIFVLIKDKWSLVSKLLFLTSLFFSFWVFDILVLWIAAYNDAVMFGWEITPLFEVPLFIFSLYFAYVVTDKNRKDIPLNIKLLFVGLMGIVFLILPTSLNIVNYDIWSCEGVPGIFWDFMYSGEMIFIAWIFGICLSRFRSLSKGDLFRKQIVYFGTGIISFLVLFTGSNLVGQISRIQEISFIGSLGMVAFLALLTFTIVRYKAFSIKLVGAQALIFSLIALIGSQFFFIQSNTNKVLTAITLVITGFIGINLIRSVKKEVAQRERIELLAQDLELANTRQASLIHFITHQVKGFFTKSRNIFSMILEGDYGVIPAEVKVAAEEGLSSDTKGVTTVQEILNASNIKKGTVAYAMQPLDFKSLVEDAVTLAKADAEKKGLELSFEVADGPYNMSGDADQLKHVIKNLIDNSVKYTPSGNVWVKLERKGKKVLFSVKDTGVGISKEDFSNLFKEGGRGKDSVKINVESTGYGLFIAKAIVEAHGGRIWAESDGANKGSSFLVEI